MRVVFDREAAGVIRSPPFTSKLEADLLQSLKGCCLSIQLLQQLFQFHGHNWMKVRWLPPQTMNKARAYSMFPGAPTSTQCTSRNL